jgi:hypothetical protein
MSPALDALRLRVPPGLAVRLRALAWSALDGTRTSIGSSPAVDWPSGVPRGALPSEWRDVDPRSWDRVLRVALAAEAGDLVGLGGARRWGGDWHADPGRGGRYDPRALYRTRPGLQFRTRAEIRVPWETARFQEAIPIALLAATHNLRDSVRRFVRRVRAWRRCSPHPYGIHWMNSMEVAIRGINLHLAWSIVRHLLSAPDDRYLRRLLHLHGMHLMLFPEDEGVKGNHYLCILAGLVVLGSAFRTTPDGARWIARGWESFQREVRHQVNGDGTYFEGSIGYHRLAMEAILLAVGAGLRSGLAIEPRVADRLARMAEFVEAYVRPDGSYPLVGDADDGRVVAADPDLRDDHRYLAAAVRRLLGADVGAGPVPVDVAILAPRGIADRGPHRVQPEVRAFPDGGYWFLGNRASGDRCLVRCGPAGAEGNRGHAHCDQLGIDLCVGGVPLLVDRGSGAYAGDLALRNLLRSTEAHNVVRVDGQEQSRFPRDGCFRMEDDAHAECLEFDEGRFRGRHMGYARLDPALRVEREVQRLGTDDWSFRDRVDGCGRHTVEMFWHFAPERTVRLERRRLVADGVAIELDAPDAELRLDRFPHAIRFGRTVDAQRGVLRVSATLPWEVRWTVRPLDRRTGR